MSPLATKGQAVDPLHVRWKAANLEDETRRFFLHENRSQFPEEKISFVLSFRLAAFPRCARGLFLWICKY